MNFIKKFLRDEEGMETIEVVVIIAVLVTVALVFKGKITEYVGSLTDELFSDENITDMTDIKNDN